MVEIFTLQSYGKFEPSQMHIIKCANDPIAHDQKTKNIYFYRQKSELSRNYVFFSKDLDKIHTINQYLDTKSSVFDTGRTRIFPL